MPVFDREYRGFSQSPPVPDVAIAALAARQHSVVATWQLLGLGLSQDAIERRVARGRLHRLYRGVYAVGHPAVSVRGWSMAAVLACGPGAVASHRTAGVLHGFLPSWPDEPEVTVAQPRRSRPGIRVHTSRRLAGAQTTRRGSIPVTTPARTLVDLAEILPPRQLERALAEAEVLRVVHRSTLAVELERTPGRRGAKALMELLAVEPARTKSGLEEAFLALIRGSDLPQPETNQRIAGFEVDFIWRQQRLVVELDGYQFHGTRAKFESDRRRDAALQIAGHRVIRITWQRMQERAALLKDLRALLV
ncbi:MAG: hypothetical protein JWN32_752 [Solirubrobacterales bacterium]|nr:hypothetical protein [Solirubrobacterales bacterium]